MKKILILLLALTSPCWASISYVHGAVGTSSSSADSVIVPGGGVTAGNILIVTTKTAATTGTPTVAITDTGVACVWHLVTTSSLVNATAIFAMYYCNIPATGALTVTATWTGGSGATTALVMAEYSSTTGWANPALVTSTATQKPTADTTCNTGNTTSSIPPGNLAIGDCETFPVAQTWTGTVGAFTNRASSSGSTSGWYDSTVATLGVQSFSTTITSDIDFAIIAIFNPLGYGGRGKAIVF